MRKTIVFEFTADWGEEDIEPFRKRLEILLSYYFGDHNNTSVEQA